MNLESLLAQYKLLKDKGRTTEEKARRGLAFERLLSDLFRLQGILMTEPFRIVGEQIDGAFEYKGWIYLVEAKWQGKKQSTNALYAFQGKSDRRIEGTRGLFISMSGFYKASVDRFGKGRKPNTLLWMGEHIEVVLTGLTTIPELLDLSVRFAAERGELLVSPNVLLASRDEEGFAAALQACVAQVDAEISSMVGKKFIPKLYVERKAQERLDEVIHPERQLQRLLSELRKLHRSSLRTKLMSKSRGVQGQRNILMNLMESVRSLEKTSLPYDSILRVFLDALPKELNGRMHILTARAGTGKTNLLCHLAKHYVRGQPTIFLTGRSGITERTSIKEIIESRLRRFSMDPLPRECFFDRLISVIEKQDTSLLVFLDAMNEHRDLDLLNTAITHFLLEIRGKPVIVIASCRDVYWSFFYTSTWPTFQWSKLDLNLDVYSSGELERAVKAYFDFYNIDASLSEEAKDKLSHPLILRFFCEAYGDPSSPSRVELHQIPDIRFKVLFDDYLARKLDSIRHTAPRRRRTTREIENCLFSLADRMRRSKTREVSRDDVPVVTKQADLESPESVYVAILGEDIILEEEPEEETGRINVVFTYDEFMEYIIARSMVRSCHPLSETRIEQLVKECESGIDDFPSFVGILEYLSIILREDHGLAVWDIIGLDPTKFGTAVSRAIAKLGSDFLGEPEIRILGQMIHSSFREIRQSAVHCLNEIVIGKRYEKQWRAGAIDLLREVLMHQDDVLIRADAVKCFEEDEIASLSEAARNIASWWKSKKEEMKSKTIVWSDDEQNLLKMLERFLKDEGFEHIYLETDPLRTIQVVEKVKPAIIITDMKKPKMSGEEMARTIKANPSLAEIPILSFSAYLYEEIGQPNIFCAAISKPADIKSLLRVIQMILVGKYEE